MKVEREKRLTSMCSRLNFKMKSLAVCMLVSLLCLLTTGCSNEESMNVNDINKQTILVFMPWSGNSNGNGGLYSTFRENLDSIESAIRRRRSMTGRLLVFISTSPQSDSLFEVTYDRSGIHHKPIKTYSGHVYTTADGITQILTDVQASATALNYAMIVGCHGTGWLSKDDWTHDVYQAKGHRPRLTSSLKRIPTMSRPGDGKIRQWPQTRFFGSTSDISYAIDVDDLAQGITQSGIKLQYLLFDDCYMANIETAYALRNATNWLVASTSEVMQQGMPYATMWNQLSSATPSYQSLVSSFYTYYSSYFAPYGALSAIDCRQVERLSELMKEINSHYTLSDSLVDSVQVLDGFHTPIFYDLGDYVGHLCQNTTLMSDFLEQLDKVVPYKQATDTLYSNLYNVPAIYPAPRYSGITVSDPSRNVVAVKGRSQTAWWKATH